MDTKNVTKNECLVTIRDAARRLGVSHWGVRRWVNLGVIPVVRLSSRILIRESEIQAIIEHGLVLPQKREGKKPRRNLK